MSFSRRHLLKGIGATALSAATLNTLGTALHGFQAANAADVTDYRALVCIFLWGGMDCHDVLLPYDQANYDKFANVRASLMSQYSGKPGGYGRARADLKALNPINAADFGGRRFALAPELTGLYDLFEAGNAAIVANTGPLIRPLNRTQWHAGTVPTPKQLFSHNDQQSTWVSSAPEGARYGWGGKFADAAAAAGANANKEFTTITALGNELFLTGQDVLPYQIGLDGAAEVNVLDRFNDSNVLTPMRRLFTAEDFAGSNLIQRDVASISKNAIELNESFNGALNSLVPLSTAFPANYLGQQMRSIANTIAIRGTLSMRRQVFFAAIGGFDTHSGQATDLPTNMRQVDEAISAFYKAMTELGLADKVTTFTASDFGRTLAVNGDGTDHGWGSHHFVIGNAVQGKKIYGDVPPPEFGHAQDADSGRLIPTISVEQYAEPLGRWFGLTDGELNAALPNLANFSTSIAMQGILRADT